MRTSSVHRIKRKVPILRIFSDGDDMRVEDRTNKVMDVDNVHLTNITEIMFTNEILASFVHFLAH